MINLFFGVLSQRLTGGDANYCPISVTTMNEIIFDLPLETADYCPIDVTAMNSHTP